MSYQQKTVKELNQILSKMNPGDPRLIFDITRRAKDTEKSVYYDLVMKFNEDITKYQISSWIGFQACIPKIENRKAEYKKRLDEKMANPERKNVYKPDGSVNIFFTRNHQEKTGSEELFKFVDLISKHLKYHIGKLTNSEGETLEMMDILKDVEDKETKTVVSDGIPMTMKFINDPEYQTKDHPQNGYSITRLYKAGTKHEQLLHPDENMPMYSVKNIGGKQAGNLYSSNIIFGNHHEVLSSGNLINPGSFKISLRVPKVQKQTNKGTIIFEGQFMKVTFEITEAFIDTSCKSESGGGSSIVEKYGSEIDDFASRFSANVNPPQPDQVDSSQIQSSFDGMYTSENKIPVKSTTPVPSSVPQMHTLSMADFAAGAPSGV